MYLISHRGAAGLAPENTLEGIKTAKKFKVDAIEVDVRPTKDSRLVLCHDHTLLRKAGNLSNVADMTLRQIQTTVTSSGHPIPTLEEAVEEAGKTTLELDLKGDGWAGPLIDILDQHKNSRFMVCSENHSELIRFCVLANGRYETYASAWGHAFDALYLAKRAKLTGVSLSYGLFNPVTYAYARKAGLKMIMSAINQPFAFRLMHRLYPNAMITTDFPDKMSKLKQA